MSVDLVSSLQTHFKFTDFLPGQADAIQSLMEGQNALVVMPTGSGKSLIFQLSALHLPGVTLVISPLIALMKDQVDSLEKRGIPATFINSALKSREQIQRLKGMTEGRYRLVYIAPERLRSINFLEALQRQKVCLIAVDEAHCISEWGHDFRPDYLHITRFRNALGNPLTVALTATATPQVQDDIVRLLGMPDAKRIVTGFNRPNLALEVRYVTSVSDRLRALHDLLNRQEDGAAIIYVGTRRDAEEVAEFISSAVGKETEYYHAGLLSEDRTRVQEAFIVGDLPIVVATNAFGMGIDRPDVRQVIHYSLPGSLEAYYQEAGRAGRDGLPAKAVLLYASDDRALQEWFIEASAITEKDLSLIFEVLHPVSKKQATVTIDELSCQTSLPEIKIRIGLAELERAGIIEHTGDVGLQMRVQTRSWNSSEIKAVITRLKQHQHYRRTQLEHMIVYAESNSCRRHILLEHFGDTDRAEAAICCDNCQNHQPVHPATGDANALSQAERVALIILDTVRRSKYRVGREKIAQILKGSQSKDIHRFGHDKSPYYGRLAIFSLPEIKGLIDQLLQLGYFKVVGGKYPVLCLTPQGEAAIRDKAAIPLKLSSRVNPEKIKLKKAERQAGGTLEYTAQLLAEGLAPVQIANQRGLTSTTIYSHLAKLIAAGRVSVTSVVPEDTRHIIEEAIRQVGTVDYLFPIKTLLPDEIDYNIICCVVEGWKLAYTFTFDQKTGEAKPLGPSHRESGITTAILECVCALPGRLPRSGVAKILVGSGSARVIEYRSHPCYKQLDGHSRAKVMEEIDRLLAIGQLSQNESGRLILGRNEVTSPPKEPVAAFLSRSHPRPLPGPWSMGWALGFHSQFAGSDWSRSGTGELAYRLKYQGDLTVLPALVDQAVALIIDHPELTQVDAIVPVPPTTPRPNDPVSSFVKALSQRLGLAILPLLMKSRQTSPQKEMHTLAQKRANVAGAFDLQSSVKGKRLLVVDDLFDSGATLEEITRLLKRAEAASVCVLTLTRTIHSET